MVKGKVDKWKTKTWYTVFAPEIFEGKEIAHILAAEDEQLINRIIYIGLDEISGDLSQAYSGLCFRVIEVKGKSAYTKLIGHELSRGYLKTLTRRRRSVVPEVIDVTTKDGVGVRVKMNVYTARRVSDSIKSLIRGAIGAELNEKAKTFTFAELEQEILFKKFATKLYNKAKKYAPIKRVEIRKTEVAEQFA